MALIIFITLACFIGGIVLAIDIREGEGLVGTVFSAIFLGIILGLLGLLGSAAISAMISDVAVTKDICEIELSRSVEIVALKDSQDLNGSAFLFSRNIDEDLYYYYAAKTENGYKMDKIRADSCSVIYSDGTPRIDTYSATGFKRWADYIFKVPIYEEIIIYVPPGTIEQSFSIDLE